MPPHFISCHNVSKSELDTRLKEQFPEAVISQASSMNDLMEMASKFGNQPLMIVYAPPCSHGEPEVLVLPAIPPWLHDRFTQRQRQLIDLLMSGNSNKAIADRMNLSYGTVKNYVFDIMRIMSVGSRLELVAKMRAEAPQAHPFRPAGAADKLGMPINLAAFGGRMAGADE